MARQIRGIFNASDAIQAQRLLNAALKDWQVSQPQLAAWAEKNLAEGFAVFDLPEAHRVRMRTTNGRERLNKVELELTPFHGHRKVQTGKVCG